MNKTTKQLSDAYAKHCHRRLHDAPRTNLAGWATLLAVMLVILAAVTQI